MWHWIKLDNTLEKNMCTKIGDEWSSAESRKSGKATAVTELPQILHHNRQVVWGIFLFWELQAWLMSEVY